jgi:hypothetical protein
MSKKHYNTTTIENELAGASLYFQRKKPLNRLAQKTSKRLSPSQPTRNATQPRETSRDHPRALSRRQSHEQPGLPSRNEIQEFSFKLRDELKVKVQAEVPPEWQKELDNLAHDLGVKKLELYRFILGEFLGKVKRRR